MRSYLLFVLLLTVLIAYLASEVRRHSNRITVTTAMTTPSVLLSQTPPVIVVGSGLAGLAAASQLISHNIPVQLLERAPKPGGNSIKASSGINGAPTRFQPVSNDVAFYSDTVKSAGSALASAAAEERARRERLISTLTNSSADAVYWLTDEKGIDLSKVAQLGGHSVPRTHRGGPGQKPPGASIVGSLLELLGKSPYFTLRTGSRVTRVLRESDEVLGVEYERSVGEDGKEKQKESLKGPVVFASGGFAGDAHGMLAQYRPDLAGFPTTNEAREGSQPLLTGVGADLLDMDRVQVHPTGFIDPNDSWALAKILAAEMLRGEGGILLTGEGKRFVNELDTRDKVTDAVLRSAKSLTKDETTATGSATRQWDVTLVLDESTAEATSSHLGFYKWKGLVKKTTIGELGPAALETIRAYADIVSGEKPDPLGRPAFGSWSLGKGGDKEKDITADSVVYIGKVTPVVHFTMGGVAIDEHSQVLDTRGVPIKGLWAAGEITGGLHGNNRLGGSSLLECVVFGRIAGDGAAEFYKKHYRNTGN
ncbi:hypothetical protein MAP00_005847 [Monascus purpureus]|nr:hypothetical protein MAP00_005847 [Monascus purpureus]